MSEEKFNLDRETNIANNVDALGKRWVIKRNKNTGLCWAAPEPYRSDFQCPKQMKGLWTKPPLLQEQIQAYLKESWDHAEKVAQKLDRKEQASKEAKSKAA